MFKNVNRKCFADQNHEIQNKVPESLNMLHDKKVKLGSFAISTSKVHFTNIEYSFE